MSEDSGSSTSIHYCAFLSYSHADRKQAERLHRALERYRVPKSLQGTQGRHGPVPGSLYPIFRDRDELAASSDIRQLHGALEASERLIVVCSPASARSLWVNEEILFVKKLARADHILAVIVAGEPGASRLPGRAEEECFPPALAFRLGEDGNLTDTRADFVAADMRPHADGEENATLKLIAALLGVDFETLRQRELRAARARARRAQALAAVMAVLAITAIAGGLLSYSALRMADRNMKLAVRSAVNIVQDISTGLRDVEGIRTDTVAALLGRAENVFAILTRQLPSDPRLTAGQALALAEIAETYRVKGDLDNALRAANEARALADTTALSRSFLMKITQPMSDPNWKIITDAAQSVSRSRLADILREKGEHATAQEHYEAALTIMRQLSESENIKSPGKSHDILLELAMLEGRLGDMAKDRGDPDTAVVHYNKCIGVLDPILSHTPDDDRLAREISVCNERLGVVYEEQGRLHLSLRALQRVLAVRTGLAERDPSNMRKARDVAFAHQGIGRIFFKQRELSDALVSYTSQKNTYKALLDNDPSNAENQYGFAVAMQEVGRVLKAQNKPGEALLQYSLAMQLLDRITRLNSSNIYWQNAMALVLRDHAEVLLEQGRKDEALAEYRRSHAISELVASKAPEALNFEHDLSVSFGELGDAFSETGFQDEALRSYRASLEMQERLVQRSPNNTQWRRDVALTMNKLADLLVQRKDFQQALEHYTDSITIRRELSLLEPTNTQWRRDLALGLWDLGRLNHALKQPEQALEAYKEAIGVADSLAEAVESKWRRIRSVLYVQLGDLYREIKNLDGVILAYSAALSIREALYVEQPSDLELKKSLAAIHTVLGGTFYLKGNFDESFVHRQRSFSLAHEIWEADKSDVSSERRLADATETLAHAVRKRGNIDQAIEYYRKAILIWDGLAFSNPADMEAQISRAEAHDKLASTLMEKQDYAEALKEFSEYLSQMHVLSKKRDLEASQMRDVAQTRNIVGLILDDSRKKRKALREFDTAAGIYVRLVSDNPEDSQLRDEWSESYEHAVRLLINEGRYQEAIARLQEMVALAERMIDVMPEDAAWQTELKETRASVYGILGMQAESRRRTRSAAHFYRQAADLIAQLTVHDPSNAEWSADKEWVDARLRDLRSPIKK